MKYFYSDSNNAKVGPLPIEALQSLHASGVISDATSIAQEGSDKLTPYQMMFGNNAVSNTPAAETSATPPALPDILKSTQSWIKNKFESQADRVRREQQPAVDAANKWLGEQQNAQGKRVQKYKIEAENGDAISQFQLGESYESGFGVAKNEDEANRWYQKAADQGYSYAEYKLGEIYEFGWGIRNELDQGADRALERASSKATLWYQKSAEHGHTDAEFKLGERYEFGRGVEKNEKEAQIWYRKAADKGNKLAIHKLEDIQSGVLLRNSSNTGKLVVKTDRVIVVADNETTSFPLTNVTGVRNIYATSDDNALFNYKLCFFVCLLCLIGLFIKPITAISFVVGIIFFFFARNTRREYRSHVKGLIELKVGKSWAIVYEKHLGYSGYYLDDCIKRDISNRRKEYMEEKVKLQLREQELSEIAQIIGRAISGFGTQKA